MGTKMKEKFKKFKESQRQIQQKGSFWKNTSSFTNLETGNWEAHKLILDFDDEAAVAVWKEVPEVSDFFRGLKNKKQKTAGTAKYQFNTDSNGVVTCTFTTSYLD